MTKAIGGEFETIVKRLLSTPPKPHSDSKIGKPKPGGAKPAKRTAGKGRVRVGRAKK